MSEQSSSMATELNRLTDDEIAVVYRHTFPSGLYLITGDVMKFARAIEDKIARRAPSAPALPTQAGDLPSLLSDKINNDT